MAAPKADHAEWVLGLTMREWTLMGAAAVALVVFAGAIYVGFRSLRG